MATIQCSNCGRRISTKVKSCPHCGEQNIDGDTSASTTSIFTLEEKENIGLENHSKGQNNMLIKCKACEQMISKNAQSCPHCGEPTQITPKSFKPTQKKKKTSLWTWLVLLLFIGWFIGMVSDKEKGTSTISQHKIDKPKKEDRTTLKGGYFACTTDALFDEITMASVRKDNLAIGHLLSIGCVLTKAGVRFSIIDFGMATTKIRAYDGSDSIILYTNTENVMD